MNEILLEILEHIFSTSLPRDGEPVDSTLVYSVPWPSRITLLVLILIAVVITAIYCREPAKDVRLWRISLPARFLRIVLITARLFLFALIFFMFYEWSLSPYRTRRPDLAVIADVSQSMSLPVRHPHESLAEHDTGDTVQPPGVESRLDFVRDWLLDADARRLRQLMTQYNVKFFLVGSSMTPRSAQLDELVDTVQQLQPIDTSSQLGNSLRSVLAAQRGRSTAAIIFFTDGVTTQGPTLGDASAEAVVKNIPLYLAGLGSPHAGRDVAVGDLLVDEVVFVNDVVHFDVNVTSSGFDSQAAEVVLKKRGSDEVLADTTIRVNSARQSQRVQIPYTANEPGDHDFIVEVVPLAGEAATDNNRVSVRISVRDDQIHVLLVQSYPNFEFRFLRNVLARADDSIQLSTILQEADYEYATTDEHAKRVFPVSREELFQYDVIIFGDVNPSSLTATAQEHLFDFVAEKGGGVVFVAGPAYLPTAYRDARVGALLPLHPGQVTLPPRDGLSRPFQVRPTSLGLAAPQLQLGVNALDSARVWHQLPGLYWLLEAGQWKPGVRVLVEHSSNTGQDGQPLPVITLHYVGSGKVVFHATDETWRWRYRVGDVFFARYWLQTIRYLGRSKLVGKDRGAEVSTDRTTYGPGDQPLVRIKFFDDRLAPDRDDGVTVTLRQRNGAARRVDLRRAGDQRGIFEATLQNLAAGDYDVTLAQPLLFGSAPSTSFTVTAPPGELAQPTMNQVELEYVAEVTGGRFYTEADIETLLSDLPAGRQVPVEALQQHKLWNSWWIAASFVAVLTCEWLLRKKASLS